MTSILHAQLKKEAVNISMMPTLKFIGVGVLWIVLSDLALFLTQNSATSHFPIFHVEVLKGILFVIAMGVFFFAMQRRNDQWPSEVVHLDLFKKNPQSMWIYDLKTMVFLEVNEAAVNRYGYTREEFLSMRICDIRPAEDMPKLVQAMEQLKSGFRFIGSSRHLHKNGSIINTEISAFAIAYRKHQAGLIMATDVTNQVNAEAALVEATKAHAKQTHDKLYELALYNKELQIRIREINANNDELIEVTKMLEHSSRRIAARYEAKLQRSSAIIENCMANTADAIWMLDLQNPHHSFISSGAMEIFNCNKGAMLEAPYFWQLQISQHDRTRINRELLLLNEVDLIKVEYVHAHHLKRISQSIEFLRDEDDCVEKILFKAAISRS